jgi:hypothetical protein
LSGAGFPRLCFFRFGGKLDSVTSAAKASLIREHLPQRWKRCATQKQSFFNNLFRRRRNPATIRRQLETCG